MQASVQTPAQPRWKQAAAAVGRLLVTEPLQVGVDDAAARAGSLERDRRSYVRMPVENVESNLGPVLDLSLGGVCVSSASQLSGRQRIVLFSGTESVELQGEVRWLGPLPNGRFRVGLQFVDRTEQSILRLGEMCLAAMGE
jgi:hypothetical protein